MVCYSWIAGINSNFKDYKPQGIVVDTRASTTAKTMQIMVSTPSIESTPINKSSSSFPWSWPDELAAAAVVVLAVEAALDAAEDVECEDVVWVEVAEVESAVDVSWEVAEVIAGPVVVPLVVEFEEEVAVVEICVVVGPMVTSPVVASPVVLDVVDSWVDEEELETVPVVGSCVVEEDDEEAVDVFEVVVWWVVDPVEVVFAVVVELEVEVAEPVEPVEVAVVIEVVEEVVVFAVALQA